jgi:hypothetical protein
LHKKSRMWYIYWPKFGLFNFYAGIWKSHTDWSNILMLKFAFTSRLCSVSYHPVSSMFMIWWPQEQVNHLSEYFFLPSNANSSRPKVIRLLQRIEKCILLKFAFTSRLCSVSYHPVSSMLFIQVQTSQIFFWVTFVIYLPRMSKLWSINIPHPGFFVQNLD